MKKSINIFCILLCLSFFSCEKLDRPDNTDINNRNLPRGRQNVSIHFTNNSDSSFSEVLVDIDSVKVLVDTCATNYGHHDTCNVWESLPFTPGVYNLLSLSNGGDTLFASGSVPLGEISLIKLVLGPADSLIKDSISYPLKLSDSSIILINTDRNTWNNDQGYYRTWLNFNTAGSLIELRNNQFYLDPVITAFSSNTVACISGYVEPVNSYPVITVFNNNDTAYALPDRNGHFTVRGLDPGTYNLLINGSNGYADSTITGINLTAGEKDKLGNIELHK